MTTETIETTDDLILEAARAAAAVIPIDDREALLGHVIGQLQREKLRDPLGWMPPSQQAAAWRLLADIYCRDYVHNRKQVSFAHEFFPLGTQAVLALWFVEPLLVQMGLGGGEEEDDCTGLGMPDGFSKDSVVLCTPSDCDIDCSCPAGVTLVPLGSG